MLVTCYNEKVTYLISKSRTFLDNPSVIPSMQRKIWKFIWTNCESLILKNEKSCCTLNSLKNLSKSYYQHRGMWCTSYPWPQDPPCVLQDSRKPLGGRGESWHPFNAPICMKFSPNILGTNMDLLTPQAGVSGTSMSSKTPGSHLEDGESLFKWD